MIAEIWVGSLQVPAYKIRNVKRVETSMDGSYCKITDDYGCTYETSPHNVVLLTTPTKKGGEAE